MIIAIDGNEANVQEKVGVSIYTNELLKYFQKQATDNLRFTIFLRDKPQQTLPQETVFFKYEVVPGKILWSQIFLPLRLLKGKLLHEKIDVFFSPAHYAPRFSVKNLVVTIHDLSFFYYPDEFLKKDLYKLKEWTAYSIAKARKIIAVSKTTKKDLIKFYNLPDDKIEVIYNGFEKSVLKEEEIADFKLPLNKYFLYVGTLQPRKNINILIRAFNLFHKDFPEYKLVIAGKKGWMYEHIFNEVKQLGLENEIYFTGYITDGQLVHLYKHAFCFIMPSLYEGFGIPVLEAMSFNCPVISSFNASLPEVGNDTCLYFDPTSEKDLLEHMKILKENADLRKELIKKGQERVKLFSWSTCAQKTLDLLKSTA